MSLLPPLEQFLLLFQRQAVSESNAAWASACISSLGVNCKTPLHFKFKSGLATTFLGRPKNLPLSLLTFSINRFEAINDDSYQLDPLVIVDIALKVKENNVEC